MPDSWSGAAVAGAAEAVPDGGADAAARLELPLRSGDVRHDPVDKVVGVRVADHEGERRGPVRNPVELQRW
jgi:hypothetical protein